MSVNWTNIGSRIKLTGVRCFVFAFLLGFAVRLIPEILSFPKPIGFDTIYYAWRIKQGVVWFHWSEVFSSWLLYGFLIPIYDFFRADPFMMLKASAPILFGFNTSGIYYFARKALNWSPRKGLFAALFFSFQVAALSISWEFYRNLLGLGLLLFALPFVKAGPNNIREFAVLTVLSLLVAFAHEFAMIILLVAAFWMVFFKFVREDKIGALKLIGTMTPAIAISLGRILSIIFPFSYAVPGPNVLNAFTPTGHYSGLLQLFTNYLGVFDTVQAYSSYFVLLSHVVSLFALLFGLVLPCVLVGFFRDKVLDVWTGLLLVGGFGLVVVPWFALDMWSRWMLMLVYPFTFFAVNGVAKIIHGGGFGVAPIFRRLGWLRLTMRSVRIFLAASFSLGLIFMSCPLLYGVFGLVGLPTTVNYVPSTMQSNSLPLVDVDSAVKALQYVNVQMDSNAAFLGQDAFYWWSRLYLNESHTIVYFKNDFAGAISLAWNHGYKTLYLLWWNVNIGWYGVTVPDYFIRVQDFGRISVYELRSA